MSKIHHLFEEITRQFPNQCAISHITDRITYAALNARANQVARYLMQTGIQPGDYVPIIADKSIPTLTAVLAVLKIGAVYVPINPESSDSMLHSILADTKATDVLMQSDVKCVLPDRLRSFQLDDLKQLSAGFSAENMTQIEFKDDQAYVMHTSGTTGKPKGVMVSHENLKHTFSSWQKEYALTPEDRHLQMAHFTFDVFTGDWVRALCSGGQLVLCPKEVLLNPARLYALIADQKITCGEFVPVVLKQLLNFLEKEKLSLSSFRLLVCGSDQWTMRDYRRTQKVCGQKTRVINSYGCTEATIDSTYFEADDKTAALPDTLIVPIGKPFSHVQLHILDEKRQPVKAGETGEIYISGAGVALGYLARPDMTAERFISLVTTAGEKVHAYKTGDSAYSLPDGNTAFIGRHQTQIKINGQRVELPAIEHLLNAHPKIKQAVAVPVEIGGTVQIDCFLVLSDLGVTYQELTSYLKQTLPCYSMPKRFYAVEDIDLSTSGKIDRRAISQKSKREIKPLLSMPRNTLEIQIAQIWAEVLKLDLTSIGREQSFMELGGSSLEYVVMMETLNRQFSLNLPLSAQDATVSALASQVHTYRQSRKYKIAIIGGGAAAVATLTQLLAELKTPALAKDVEISVFEKSDAIGPGLPYAGSKNCYLLNLPKEIMEPVFGQTGVFAQWLKALPGAPQDTAFPPRHYFGQYLQFLAHRLQSNAAVSGIVVKYYTRCEVLDIKPDGHEKYGIRTRQGDYSSHYVILCTGHMPTATYRHLMNVKGYRHNPWASDVFADIKTMDHVGMIGTRLTAIDAAINLLDNGHRGPVTMVSRTGLLPAVLSRTVPAYTLQYLTLNNFTQITRSGLTHLPLNTLLDLFWKEISAAENKPLTWDSIVKSTKEISTLDWINREIAQAENGPKPWQQVLFAIYPIIPNIWTYLSFSDRKIFLEKYYSVFMSYLGAFPLENAYKIRAYLQSGQLQVYGGLQEVNGQDWHYQLCLEGRAPVTPQHLINATGPGYNPLLMPLYANMYRNRLIRKHHLGGIVVNPQTLQVSGASTLFAIGELTRGTCLATTDMNRVNFQATHVSLQIKQSLLLKQKVKPEYIPKTVVRNYNSLVFFKKSRFPSGATTALGLLAAGMKSYQSRPG